MKQTVVVLVFATHVGVSFAQQAIFTFTGKSTNEIAGVNEYTTNDATFVTDRHGDERGALSLAASRSSYLHVPLTEIQGKSEFAVTMWIKPDLDARQQYQCLVSMATNGPSQFFVCLDGSWEVVTADAEAGWFLGPDSDSSPYVRGEMAPYDQATVPRDEWSFIALTRYADGMMVLRRLVTPGAPGGGALQTWMTDKAVSVPADLPSGMVFGNEVDTWPLSIMDDTTAFIGLMDDIQIFIGTLSESELNFLREPVVAEPTATPTLFPYIEPQAADTPTPTPTLEESEKKDDEDESDVAKDKTVEGEDSNVEHPEGAGQWVWGAMAGGAAAVVLCLIVVVILLVCESRKKKKAAPCAGSGMVEVPLLPPPISEDSAALQQCHTVTMAPADYTPQPDVRRPDMSWGDPVVGECSQEDLSVTEQDLMLV